MSTPLYIFDLDGTLADITHRLHYIQQDKKDWRGFFAACVDDAPILPTIRTLQALHKSGADVWIWSGRSDECKAQTVKWLQRHVRFGFPTDVLWLWPTPIDSASMVRRSGNHSLRATL